MRSRLRSVPLGLSFALVLLTSGCAGALYKVKPPVTTALPVDAKSGAAGPLAVAAIPLLTDEESQELFEANLPMSGIVPVRVELTNTGEESVDLGRAKIQLRDFTGQQWKLRTGKQTAERVMDYYGVTVYNPASRKEYLAAMQQHGFDLKSPLAPGEHRAGLLFFQSPRKEPVDRPAGLVLSFEKVPQPLSVPLN
jgi:hypothetical protein